MLEDDPTYFFPCTFASDRRGLSREEVIYSLRASKLNSVTGIIDCK